MGCENWRCVRSATHSITGIPGTLTNRFFWKQMLKKKSLYDSQNARPVWSRMLSRMKWNLIWFWEEHRKPSLKFFAINIKNKLNMKVNTRHSTHLHPSLIKGIKPQGKPWTRNALASLVHYSRSTSAIKTKNLIGLWFFVVKI